MACEVCGKPTSEESSDAPADDVYFTAVFPGDVGITEEFEFCSVGHLNVFMPPEHSLRGDE